jgi:hypothetical protein
MTLMEEAHGGYQSDAFAAAPAFPGEGLHFLAAVNLFHNLKLMFDGLVKR